MDWPMIVERNRERLLLAIAPLLAVLGFDQRRREEVPRHFHARSSALLRPAESAVRRLIIIAAIGIVVKLRLGASRAFPAGLAQRLKMALERRGALPGLCLIDPLKRFAPADFGWAQEWSEDWGKEQVVCRAFRFPACIDPVFPQAVPVPNRNDPIDTTVLLRRIRSLKEALDNLPRHAKRLARWKAKGELPRQPGMPHRPGRLSPFRPGPAPGKHLHEERGIDAILGDCHYFARKAWDGHVVSLSSRRVQREAPPPLPLPTRGRGSRALACPPPPCGGRRRARPVARPGQQGWGRLAPNFAGARGDETVALRK